MLKKIGGVGLLACGILLLCAVSSVNSYSKFGRGCNDIGCLPTEECVISSDSCSYSQRDGKDCGNFPTCKKKSGVSTSSSSSSVNPSGFRKKNFTKLTKRNGKNPPEYKIHGTTSSLPN